MSTTDVDLARMVGRLRSYKRGPSNYYYDYRTHRYGYRNPGKQIWSDEQIMEAFGLNKERFDELIKLHQNSPPRYLLDKEWKKRYFDFWTKNKRWHENKDCRNWKKTGLQSTNYDKSHWIEEYCHRRKAMLRKYPGMILSIPNLTTRRNMIEEMGGVDTVVALFVASGGAEEVQQDDFGTLWKINHPDGRDRHMLYVEVVNSTPQLNKKGNPKMKGGKPVYDHYFLRVPPTTRTARAGVAWTFNKPEATFAGFAAQSRHVRR